MARYIIEDINEEYVYCDQMNENHREVVKSILNNLVSDCPDHKHSKIDAECNMLIEQYG